MNLKLTGLREVVGGLSDPGGFVHSFIFEKIRLMRKKKFAETKKWQNILHLTELENGKKMH